MHHDRTYLKQDKQKRTNMVHFIVGIILNELPIQTSPAWHKISIHAVYNYIERFTYFHLRAIIF